MSEAIAEADRRIENIIRVGKVTSVDPGTATAIVDFGDLPSPPLPVGQLGAGAIQFWWMPSVGEQVLVACEGGDIAQGTIVCSIYAGNAPSSDGAVPQVNLAGGKMIVNGTLEVTVDVIAAGVSLVHHTHPESIGTNTGEPN
jgi:phage baseplate assembly protein gpV